MPITANHKPIKSHYDVVLIGGGIMSATLGTLLHELDPKLNIVIFERLGRFARESSAAWNNAGTGHSAFCELNYTPQKKMAPSIFPKQSKLLNSLRFQNSFGPIYSPKIILISPKTSLILVHT